MISVCKCQLNDLPNNCMHARVQMLFPHVRTHIIHVLIDGWTTAHTILSVIPRAWEERKSLDGEKVNCMWSVVVMKRLFIYVRPVTVLFAQPCNRLTTMGRLNYVSKRARTAFYTRRGHTLWTHAYLSVGGPRSLTLTRCLLCPTPPSNPC